MNIFPYISINKTTNDMTTLDRHDFIQDSRYPVLAEAVLDQLGADFEEVTECPHDYRDASAGVSGFIYYSETVQFAKDNFELIEEALNDFEEECGKLNRPDYLTDGETAYYNWMAWFALESVIQEIIDQIER